MRTFVILLGMAAAATAATPVDDLLSKMTPAARAKFAGIPADGHQLAQALLAPLPKAGRSTNRTQADTLLRNRVSLLGGYEPQDLGFPYDWFRAPKQDWQWPTHLSRHYYLMPLAEAYAGTGDRKYADRVAAVLLDWTRRFPLGAEGLTWRWKAQPSNGEGVFTGYVDGPWTSLSAHARTDTWLKLLATIANAECMDNLTTATLLNSLLTDHRRLMLDYPRTGTANQFIAIGASLVNLGLSLPDFEGAAECRRVGLERITDFATRSIYPDGSVAECSPNYGLGSIGRVKQVALDLKARGVDVPDVLFERLRAAIRYYAFTADPKGRSPRIAKGGAVILPTLEALNREVNDAEAAWIAAKGARGTKPARLNYGFDWAGHFVFRTGWSDSDTWLFFEPGPRGAGHHDLAQLGIQLVARGEALLCDPGYYSYSSSGEEGAIARQLHSTFSHNAAVVDGEGQVSGTTGANKTPGDYHWSDEAATASAEGTYTNGFGEKGRIAVRHNRRVTLQKATGAFVVEDAFNGAGEHAIGVLWQAPPKAAVEIGERSVVIGTAHSRLTLEFESATPIEITKRAGWYSEHYGELAPSTTIVVTLRGASPALRTKLRVQAAH